MVVYCSIVRVRLTSNAGRAGDNNMADGCQPGAGPVPGRSHE